MAKNSEQIRWNINRAAAEFGVDRAVLARALKSNSIEPAFDDGSYSTANICAAVYGDLESEKIRETRHKANLLSMEEDEKRGVLVDVAEVKQVLEKICVGVKAVVQASHLLPEEQDDILKHLQSSIGEAWKC